MNSREHQIYLSRRNLLTLLSKLDRVRDGEHSFCTIVKSDHSNAKYPQTMLLCRVTAVEDNDYYADRDPGEVLSEDDPSAKEAK